MPVELNLLQGLHRRWETAANEDPRAGYFVKRAKKLCPLRSLSSCCSDGSRKVSGVEARCWKHNQVDTLESTVAVMQAPFDPGSEPCASAAPSWPACRLLYRHTAPRNSAGRRSSILFLKLEMTCNNGRTRGNNFQSPKHTAVQGQLGPFRRRKLMYNLHTAIMVCYNDERNHNNSEMKMDRG